MSMLSEVGTYMAANGIGTLGTDLFLGLLPVRPTNCVGLIERPGRAPVLASAKKRVAERPGLIVQVRNVDYETGYTKSKTVNDLIQSFQGTLSGTRYLYITATTAIGNIGVDDNNAWTFLQYFDVMKEPS